MPRMRLVVAGTVTAAAMILGSPLSASAVAVKVADWRMDDGGTTMLDSSGRNHPGTLHNVATKQAGFAGTSFGFRTKPAYVTVPTATDLNPGTSPFSVTMHVRFSTKPSAAVVDYDLLRKGLSSTAGGSYKVEILQSGVAYCNFRGSAGEGKVTGATNLANNAWHTITCSRTSSSVKLTVDGRSVSKTVTTGSISNSSTVYIGAKDASGGDQYSGLLDAVTVTKG